MQKLVTIFLSYDIDQYGKANQHHGAIQEHLSAHLADGWIVKTMVPVGTSAGAGSGMERFPGFCITKGWLAVLLEK